MTDQEKTDSKAFLATLTPIWEAMPIQEGDLYVSPLPATLNEKNEIVLRVRFEYTHTDGCEGILEKVCADLSEPNIIYHLKAKLILHYENFHRRLRMGFPGKGQSPGKGVRPLLKLIPPTTVEAFKAYLHQKRIDDGSLTKESAAPNPSESYYEKMARIYGVTPMSILIHNGHNMQYNDYLAQAKMDITKRWRDACDSLPNNPLTILPVEITSRGTVVLKCRLRFESKVYSDASWSLMEGTDEELLHIAKDALRWLIRDRPFTEASTEAWASLKGFKPKRVYNENGHDAPPYMYFIHYWCVGLREIAGRDVVTATTEKWTDDGLLMLSVKNVATKEVFTTKPIHWQDLTQEDVNCLVRAHLFTMGIKIKD